MNIFVPLLLLYLPVTTRSFTPYQSAVKWTKGEHDNSLSILSSSTSLFAERQRPSNDDNSENNPLQQDIELQDALLEYSIDSFLRGDYDQPFVEDAAAPLPGLSPKETVEASLQALRKVDDPTPSHGAACFLRFVSPLRRGERWGMAASTSEWKELLRGSLTPTMLAQRLRSSQLFSCLLEWEAMHVVSTESAEDESVAICTVELDVDNEKDAIATNSTTAPNNINTTLQIKLRRVGGVWLIDSIERCQSSSDNQL